MTLLEQIAENGTCFCCDGPNAPGRPFCWHVVEMTLSAPEVIWSPGTAALMAVARERIDISKRLLAEKLKGVK